MASASNTRSGGGAPAAGPWAVRGGALLVVVAGALVYANSLDGVFLYDDVPAILSNATIERLWPLTIPLHPPDKTTVEGRPLVNLTLALNNALGGYDARGYHVVNIAIHVAAGLALLGIVRRTLLHLGEAPARAAALAVAAALLWTVHPLQTEAVTYLIQRVETLMGLCYLLTLYLVIRGAESPRPWPWHAAAVLACLAGMASKEVMVSAPIMVLLYDRTFLTPSLRDALRKRRGLYLVLAATWGLLAVLAMSSGSRGESAGFGLSISPWQYLATQCPAVVHYLRLCFWPRPLVFHYGMDIAHSAGEVVPYAVVLALLAGAAAVAVWRRSGWGFLGAWFFAILAPTSSIVPIVTQTAAEHRMYLSLAAVVVAAVLAGDWLLRRVLARCTAPHETTLREMLTAGTIAAVVALFGFQTVIRNRDYHSAIQLWEDTARKRPKNSVPHVALCELYLYQNRLSAAIGEATRAIDLHPDPAAYVNRGRAFFDQQLYDKAIADFTSALELQPASFAAYYERGSVYAQLGRYDEALADLNRAVELEPRFSSAYLNRGQVHFARREFADAIADFDLVVELDPRDPIVLQLRAKCYYELAQYEQAWVDVAAARKLGDNDIDPRFIEKLTEASGRREE